MDMSCYNSYFEVDLGKIAENYNKIQKYTGVKVMPVVKANAYGMGLVEVSAFLSQHCDVDMLACAQVYEGVMLRENGIEKPNILTMGPTLPEAVGAVVKYDLQTPAFTVEGVRALNLAAAALGKTAKVHIKIESGMNRIGVHSGEELEELLDAMAELKNVEIVGIFTHFVEADIENGTFTHEQFQIFKNAVAQVKARGISPKYIHCCNTAATEWFKEAVDFSTHVRVGSLLYGYSDISGAANPIEVQESLSWRAPITHLKTIYPGESVGYGKFFKPLKKTRVAIVGVGFADGIYNPLAKNCGPVMVNGIKTKFIDTCMDQCFIDVTDVPCKLGDTVTFFGESLEGTRLSPQEFKCPGQIYTAHMSIVSDRVKRTYIGR